MESKELSAKRKEIVRLLYDVGSRWPAFLGLMKTVPGKDGRKQWEFWREMLEPFDIADLRAELQPYITGARPLHRGDEAYLVGDAARVCRHKQAQRTASAEQSRKYPSRSRSRLTIVPDLYRKVAAVSQARREGRIDAETELQRLNDLFAWERGGTKPEWL